MGRTETVASEREKKDTEEEMTPLQSYITTEEEMQDKSKLGHQE